MTAKPFLQFYPTDWRGDPALRVCSLAARGLWVEVICIAHFAEPYGHLTVNGKQLLVGQLAGLVGAKEREVVALLDELRQAGVFSVSDGGVIYSRRMVRDADKFERDRANGKKGGNPRLNGGVNPPDKPRVKREDNPPDKGGLKAQIPETRDQKERKKDYAPSGAKKYAFESGIIKLTEQNLDQWQEAFRQLDLKAELVGLTQWAGSQGGNWFCAVSGALAKRNREMSVKLEKAKAGEAKFNLMSGKEGIL